MSRWFVGRRSFIFVTEVVHTKPAKRNCRQIRFTDANTNTNQTYKQIQIKIKTSKFCAQQTCKKELLSDKVYISDAYVFPTVI